MNANADDERDELTTSYLIVRKQCASGTHRVLRPATPSAELPAPPHLGRRAVAAIITDYLTLLDGPADAGAMRAVDEALRNVARGEGLIPQPLAGQFVLALAGNLPCPHRRKHFLARAWRFLAALEP